MKRVQRDFKVSRQVTVPPMTADFVPMEGGQRFGKALCPFCDQVTSILGPESGRGLLWCASDACRHCAGTAAGAGFEVTVLFYGMRSELREVA